MTPEAKVKKQVVAIIKKFPTAYYFFPATGGYGRSGVPDIIICYCGKFLAVECKAGTRKPTPLQEHEMKCIRLAGGEAIVINEDNVNEVEERMKANEWTTI
jgi:Holliday junction resolvase